MAFSPLIISKSSSVTRGASTLFNVHFEVILPGIRLADLHRDLLAFMQILAVIPFYLRDEKNVGQEHAILVPDHVKHQGRESFPDMLGQIRSEEHTSELQS